ncbi:MAG: hypothetical protein EA398_11805 [Deltaproteobacteria bacterium]|nr:MAG: hypothetical protein EA398_11805 [Deltaproteobacteria bacterium]
MQITSGVSELTRQMREQLQDLARSVLSMANGRRDDLRAVTLAVEDPALADGLRQQFRILLERRGLADIDVLTVRASGPLRIISLEFDTLPPS